MTKTKTRPTDTTDEDERRCVVCRKSSGGGMWCSVRCFEIFRPGVYEYADDERPGGAGWGTAAR
jgi:hypothetical protein